MAAWCLSLTPRSRKCKMATYNLVDASDQLCIKTPSAESAKLQIVGAVQVNCRLLVTLFCSCLFSGKELNGLHVKFARKGMRCCWYCRHSIVCKCIHIAYFSALQLSLLILIISCPCKRPAVCIILTQTMWNSFFFPLPDIHSHVWSGVYLEVDKSK